MSVDIKTSPAAVLKLSIVSRDVEFAKLSLNCVPIESFQKIHLSSEHKS